MNMESSRSHSIATVYCETGGGDSGQIPCFGKVSFVDLAGSERVKDTRTQGGMLKETNAINRSLFTLGKARVLHSCLQSSSLYPNVAPQTNLVKSVCRFCLQAPVCMASAKNVMPIEQLFAQEECTSELKHFSHDHRLHSSLLNTTSQFSLQKPPL